MRTVFLSSTSRDLEPCREAAYRAIEGLHGYHCVRMEDFGSWDGPPDEFCRAKVGECDLFVCIAGPCYGSISPAGQSYTEREYEAATSAANPKPCLAFLTAEDYPLPANLIESDEQRNRQLAFRQRISKGMITRFSTPEQVSVKVVQAIRNWEASQTAAVPTQATLLASQIKSVAYRVAVLNQSAAVSDDEVRKVVAALQKQLDRDFAPAWGIDAELTFVAKGDEPEPGSWWLVIEDEGQYPGVLGYHNVTPEGLPQVRISVTAARQGFLAWTMAASHDLMEMLVDPQVNLTVLELGSSGTHGRLYMREVCDPVSNVQMAYEIDGVVVSNFVYPAWFEAFRKPGSAQFDHCNRLTESFQCAPGCYMSVFDVQGGGVGWHHVMMPQEQSDVSPEQPETKTKSKTKRKAAN
jgi:hypothetical protein